jgi:hypothetical protein
MAVALKPASFGQTATRRIKAVAIALPLIAGGFSLAVALRSVNASWLGWLALLPLFAAIRTCRPIAAFLGGLLWGTSVWVGATAGGAAVVDGGLLSFGLLAGVPAVYAYLGCRVTRWSVFSPIALGVGWVGVELLLQPLGLGEGLIATTQHGGTWASWLAPTLGYAMVSFVVALVSASLVSALSTVRLSVPRSALRSGSGHSGTLRNPRAFFRALRYFSSPSQPRAPPPTASTPSFDWTETLVQ